MGYTEVFSDFIESITTDGASVDVTTGEYGQHARVTDVTREEVQKIAESVDHNPSVDHAVTETASGPGIEVWTE